MAKKLGWNEEKKEEERLEAMSQMKAMGLGLITPYLSVFDKQTLLRLKKEFHAMDLNGDGSISMGDLSILLSKMHWQMDKQQLMKMIEEIDKNRNGTIELFEFLEIMSNADELKSKTSFSEFMMRFKEYFYSISTERSGGGL
jgi:Ca2+-binding EF-hand superfamily protein